MSFRITAVDTICASPARAGKRHDIHCTSLGSLGTLGRLPNPRTLRAYRLIVQETPRRYPKTVPCVVNAPTARAGMFKALRQGQRIWGARLVGVVWSGGIWFNSRRAVA